MMRRQAVLRALEPVGGEQLDHSRHSFSVRTKGTMISDIRSADLVLTFLRIASHSISKHSRNDLADIARAPAEPEHRVFLVGR